MILINFKFYPVAVTFAHYIVDITNHSLIRKKLKVQYARHQRR